MRTVRRCALFCSLFFPVCVGCSNANLTPNGPSSGGSGAGNQGSSNPAISTDLVVYGATPSGIAAAVEAARLGKRVTLLEPTASVGGMMTNGLGYTDLYAQHRVSGFPKEFFGGIKQLELHVPASMGGFAFEPHVAAAEFQKLLSAEPLITLVTGARLVAASMSGSQITGITTSTGVYAAREYIDASYAGDLMAAAHVSSTSGRESEAQYGESYAGVGSPTPIGAPHAVSSYVSPGVPSSGLLAHISSDVLAAPGSADTALGAYTYRLCVTNAPSNRIPFTPPANYDATEFELLGRYAAEMGNQATLGTFMNLEPLPNQKFDLNTGVPFETSDEVGANAGYSDATAATRAQIEGEQKRYEQAFLYFLSTDSRIPPNVQSAVQQLGLCKDEFTDNGGWPYQIYVREARRMVGDYVLTQNEILNGTAVPDSIGIGGYKFDTHATHVVSIKGHAFYENHQAGPPQPYSIPYRVLTPKRAEATNLIVTGAVSASHVAFSSLRIEISFMVMGQAGGAAASLAMDEGTAVQDVAYSSLQTALAAANVQLTP